MRATYNKDYYKYIWQMASNISACIKRPDKIAPLKKIMIIGGLIEDDKELFVLEQKRMARIASYLLMSGLPVSKTPDIELVNIHKDHGGEDFLETKAHADIIVSSYIYYNEKKEPEKNDELLQTSSSQHIKGIWHDNALRTGAKIIAVLGSKKAITITEEHFTGERYSVLDRKEDEQLTILVNTPFLKTLLETNYQREQYTPLGKNIAAYPANCLNT